MSLKQLSERQRGKHCADNANQNILTIARTKDIVFLLSFFIWS